ncbi:MAG: hypothetical protein HY744_23655 [Deltaproteobacteria bacterium]|nr:hypothetical protein [Deltaproteobacteria bacterium]
MTTLAAVLVAAAAASSALPAQAQEQQCRGTKQWYAGKCRYPGDINRIKAQEAREAARLAERQRQEAEQARARDVADCEQATKEDTPEAWKRYLAEHANGSCRQQAERRIREIEAAKQDEPAPPPPEPHEELEAAPAPVTSEPATPAAAPSPAGAPLPSAAVQPRRAAAPAEHDGPAPSGVSPLAYVGFAVGGVGLVAGVVTTALVASRVSALEDECPGKLCGPDQRGDLDGANTLADLCTASFIVAAGGVVTGLAGVVLSVSGGDERREAVVLRPSVGLGAVGLAAQF